MERSLVLLKPDAVQRGLVGEIISRLEARGLKLVGAKLMSVSGELAHRHYGEHVGKPFFDGLVSFITSSPIVAMAVEGESAVSLVRNTMGETDPQRGGSRDRTGRPGGVHREEPHTRFRLRRVGGEGARALLLGG